MKLYVGVTDNDWFKFLSEIKPDEVNFWRPGGTKTFKAIDPGSPFLFKLHSPLNFIVGGGYFVRHSALSLSLAWRCFGEMNGAASLKEFHKLIVRHRRDQTINPIIGCTILTEPFFLPRSEWIPILKDWASNIVMGRTYKSDDPIAKPLWQLVRAKEEKILSSVVQSAKGLLREKPRYGSEFLARARLGQGTFRLLVTEAYSRRCAMTGEKVIPVLEAAHIRSFSDGGPNLTKNGLLLRTDLHKLFDAGYMTVTTDHHIEVSRRIKDEFDNGKSYYSLHGKQMTILPTDSADQPAKEFLDWHNTNVFAG